MVGRAGLPGHCLELPSGLSHFTENFYRLPRETAIHSCLSESDHGPFAPDVLSERPNHLSPLQRLLVSGSVSLLISESCWRII